MEFIQPLAIRADSPYRNCNARGCYAVKDGKIARCPQLMYVPAVNKYLGLKLPEEVGFTGGDGSGAAAGGAS